MKGTPYLRKVIRIAAEDTPNVMLGLQQLARGEEPTGERVLPGVLSWGEYVDRRRTLPKSRQAVILDARWWDGADEKLILPIWCDTAKAFAAEAALIRKRGAYGRFMGVDSAAGGDMSAWVAGDRLGVTHCEERKTPNTNDVFSWTLRYMRDWAVPANHVVFDLGGGGREHAHRLRAAGHKVRAVGFGKVPHLDIKRAGTVRQFEERRDVAEDAMAYTNQRSEMAWDLRLILERDERGKYQGDKFQGVNVPGFGLAGNQVDELVRQLLAPPVRWDGQGKFLLIPKDDPKRAEHEQEETSLVTFRKLLGRSPDLFDAFCCMVFGMTHKPKPAVAGVR